MGLSLIAVTYDLNLLIVILEVALALGMVIFVHELGHFAVAKWCGVKCEKFYLGFDIYGLKLFHKQWGETEYGIGILPLGGYVKMLGQDDNPGKAAEERERSQLAGTEAGPGAAPPLDPRSYLAKSVPQRMAIISAGVIMNVIFAFICATWAYSVGVKETVCGVSAVLPGETAWRAGLQAGDRILSIDGRKTERFRDLMSAVALGNLQHGIDFEIQREGVDKPFVVNLKPESANGRLLPTIGVVSPRTTSLDGAEGAPLVRGGTPAGNAHESFKAGDQIVAVGGVPVKTFADFEAESVRQADKPLRLTLARTQAEPGEGDPKTITKVDVELPPVPVRTLGLVMTAGPITAVQDGSPADDADLRAGDKIVSIDEQPLGDPLRLPTELGKRVGQSIKLKIKRDDKELDKELKLVDRPWPEESSQPGTSISVPAAGFALKVTNVVQQVVDSSPAASIQIQGSKDKRLAPGDEIVKIEFKLPKVSEEEAKKREAEKTVSWPLAEVKPVELTGEASSWPFVMWIMQQLPADTEYALTLKNGDVASGLISAPEADWFYYDRGLRPGPDLALIRADNFQQALSMGGQETVDSLLMVYKFLRRIGSQVSPKALGGPLTIAASAGSAAYEGLGKLLLFITMLSANLAVINFLPIPLLDGGHMVFLLLEGILRRPVSEKVVVAFHYLGFVFIISLMLFVLGLDITRFVG